MVAVSDRCAWDSTGHQRYKWLWWEQPGSGHPKPWVLLRKSFHLEKLQGWWCPARVGILQSPSSQHKPDFHLPAISNAAVFHRTLIPLWRLQLTDRGIKPTPLSDTPNTTSYLPSHSYKHTGRLVCFPTWSADRNSLMFRTSTLYLCWKQLQEKLSGLSLWWTKPYCHS